MFLMWLKIKFVIISEIRVKILINTEFGNSFSSFG